MKIEFEYSAKMMFVAILKDVEQPIATKNRKYLYWFIYYINNIIQRSSINMDKINTKARAEVAA